MGQGLDIVMTKTLKKMIKGHMILVQTIIKLLQTNKTNQSPLITISMNLGLIPNPTTAQEARGIIKYASIPYPSPDRDLSPNQGTAPSQDPGRALCQNPGRTPFPEKVGDIKGNRVIMI